ncbi:hypothetical protein GCK32_012261 [Trichostrongylus colubriformis]|uniref:ShKT domain-containing protein n=1 Tax=Trichostrongylus colubriformis TaxID=6319 RepID=A0AAN8FCH2_TRICO
MKSALIMVAAIMVTEVISLPKPMEDECRDSDPKWCQEKAKIEDFCESAFYTREELRSRCGKTCDLCYVPLESGPYYKYSRRVDPNKLLGL